MSTSYAIIETGGKQYRVSPGETLATEVLPGAQVGQVITFDRVPLVRQGDEVKVGTPYLEGASVRGVVEEIGRAKKVVVFKYKPKKRYRRKRGHRQTYMITRIEEISL